MIKTTCMTAEAHVKAHAPQKALELIDSGFETLRATGEVYFESELHRVPEYNVGRESGGA